MLVALQEHSSINNGGTVGLQWHDFINNTYIVALHWYNSINNGPNVALQYYNFINNNDTVALQRYDIINNGDTVGLQCYFRKCQTKTPTLLQHFFRKIRSCPPANYEIGKMNIGYSESRNLFSPAFIGILSIVHNNYTAHPQLCATNIQI